ncbi:KAT8 regulatory NSL complex subunit 1 [Conger conger]|uniref:KAT8 regulatory NSL complex subunit 1 n=1 Tax=Conger conger TaxID=82655 RepID=UPI002A5A4CA1|nr:KAT8 regulatory NSL complex subunit 1 [Conger conger]
MAYITAGQQGAGVAPVLREAAPPASRRCMAAMAPALTDAPAEARHIRFKLAPPPSAANLLLSSARKEERCARDFQDLPAEAAGAGPRAKLQPLVASYLCSDVTSVPSTKDSLALQGVLIKQTVLQARADFLPDSYFDGGDFLPRKAQLKGPVAASGQPALNGLARKLAKPGPDRDRTVSTVNGDRPGPGRATPPPAQPPPARGDPLKAGPPPDGVPDGREAPTTALACGVELGGAASRCSPLPSAPGDGPALLPAPAPPCPDEEVRDRARQSRARQGEMEGRLRRLRKRLQVVQAKQVERHVQQQLRCLLSSALPPDAPPRPHAAALLRSGSVPAQLERLSLSGAAHLRSAEAAFDSDATVSSSGGESDVEEEQLATPDLEKRHVSLWRRAEGRVALQRASIISHWNWLQAHISDLEYRIRQQTDIYRQVPLQQGFDRAGRLRPL